ncbi:MAG: DegT/DnrJ/EryC1/StrS family aminotransferase [Candidatus Omnitrophica bacterium]|nr:DegT/DnrJ/EryC1/StrS family aminotransferase [Candidatus Omnitrophota bacterium]
MSETTLKLPSDQDHSGRDLGREEIELLSEVIASGVLNSTKGTKVERFEKEFAALHGSKHGVALASGTAAIHAAIVAVNPDPMDEIITSPITDMGAIAPIIYQGCVPVFADTDPYTYNVTAESIEKKITKKTRAVIVTHLFGNPCRMREIMALAGKNHLAVIEDCAQAYLAEYEGRKAGTIGDIGVFSLQQGKHMTTGEGGIAITDNADHARRLRLFVNKAWGYGDKNPDHYFLALNYRLTELQGAVALAQLKKLPSVVSRRQAAAKKLDARLRSIDGIKIPAPPADSTHVYWKYCLDVDPEILGFDVAELAAQLKNFGIASAPRYIQKPAFRCQVIKDGVTFGRNHFPLSEEMMRGYQDEGWCRREYPGAYQALSRVLVLPWNEFYEETHVRYIADKIHESVSLLSAVKIKS